MMDPDETADTAAPGAPDHDRAPTEGGRYVRDPDTGNLTAVDDDGNPKE